MKDLKDLKCATLTNLIQTLLAHPSHKKKTLLIRHGQSEGNLKPNMHGVADHPLNETGHLQTKNLQKHLLPFLPKIAKIKTSTMIRCIQSCHNAFDAKNDKETLSRIDYDHKLREFGIGGLENAYMDRKGMPLEAKVTFFDCLIKGHVVPLGGEGGKALMKRAVESMEEAEEGLNVFFAHSWLIYALTNEQMGKLFVGNCGAFGFVYDEFSREYEIVGVYMGNEYL